MGRPAPGIAFNQQPSDFLGPWGTAGFPRQNNFMSLALQISGQQPRLRGLARAVDALKADKQAGCHVS